MKPEKYIKKPIAIEAVKLTDNNLEAVVIWCNSSELPFGGKAYLKTGDYLTPQAIAIRTLEGVMTANVGDWVIKDVKGEFYPCKPDIFEATYEQLKKECL